MSELTRHRIPTGVDLEISLGDIPRPDHYDITDEKKAVKRKGKKYVEQAYKEVVERDGAKCKKCGATSALTLDHIVPVSLLRQLVGMDVHQKYDDIENMEILCRRCNLFKQNQLDMANPKTKPLLQKYLDLA